MSRMWCCIVLAGVSAGAIDAQSGLVKSLNQPIPGATVTASQGAAGPAGATKVVATTDQSGRYVLPALAAGAWTIEVTMFGFEPARKQVTDPEPSRQLDFTLSLRESEAAARMSRFAQGRGQDANQLETQIQNDVNASQSPQAPPASGTGDEAFLVSGSLSQGLSAGAAPDFGPVQWMGGGPGQPGGPGQQNIPGFGGGPGGGGPGGGGGGGFGGGGGGGFGGGGRGGGGFGGPGGGGRGGGGRGRGQGPGGAQFGNRRQPNEVHGMIFGTLQNSALNAKPFSLTGQDVLQPAYAQLRLGVVVGGPLLIPKVVKDPSTFFFLSYYATRAKNASAFVETVPTGAERGGDFSALSTAIRDPSTGLPFPGNVLPGVSPIAQKLLGYYPLPNEPGTLNNYAYQSSVAQNSGNFGLRVQRNITKKDRLAWHIGYQNRDGDNSLPFGFLDSTNGSGLATDLSWTRTFSPDLISTARVSFNRNLSQTTPYFANGPDVAQQLGIQGTSPNPLDFGPPNLNFSGSSFAPLSDGSPVLTRNQGQSGSESLVVVRGKHSFTFGAQYTRTDMNQSTDSNGRGTLNFTGQATGFAFADFLLGLPQSASIRYGESTYLQQNVWSAYAMDEWKVGPNLTLDLGARYEVFLPLDEKYGRMANLAIAPGFTSAAVVTPASPGVPPGLIHPDYNNLSPRLGLAWKVAKLRRSTVVRLGYGIYYNGQAYIGLAQSLTQQPPFAVSLSANTTPVNPLTLASAFLGATAPGRVTNTYAVDPSYRTPYAQTWSVSVQHDLGAGFFTEIGYLGTKGTRLNVMTTPNQGPPGTPATGSVYTYDSSVGDSILHSLQTRLQRRFRHGISMQALYTLSKSIDDSSTFGGAGNTVAQNWLDLAAERGLSSFDRRHALTMSWVLTSPFGTDGSRIASGTSAGRALKDWQLTGGLTAQTGTPLTARAGGSALGVAATGGVGSGRAEATGASISAATGFFNPAAFTLPPIDEFGDAGRNTIPGPGTVALNLGFGRSIQLGDSRRRLELRLESNNTLNHVNYTSLYTVVGASNYGLPAAAGQMRSVTAVLRFRF